MIQFHLSCKGLGDVVSGIYAACGAAKAGHEVVFHAHHPAWHPHFGCQQPGLKIIPFTEAAAKNTCDANADYWRGQLTAGATQEDMPAMTRPQWYCDNIARANGVESFLPGLPAAVQCPCPSTGQLDRRGKYILLSPFSAHRPREWQHWRRCAARISDAGIHVIAMSTAKDGPRLRKLFEGSRVELHWGMSESEVCAALRGASAFIGNDSGLAHVSAFFKRPTVVVASHLNPQFVFRPARIVSVGPPRKFGCRFCGWRPVNGYVRSCKISCDALAAIPGEAVAEVALAEVFGAESENTILQAAPILTKAVPV